MKCTTIPRVVSRKKDSHDTFETQTTEEDYIKQITQAIIQSRDWRSFHIKTKVKEIKLSGD